MNRTVVDVHHLYKEYRLGFVGRGSLRQDLQSYWAGIRGKPDPNSLIGTSEFRETNQRILALQNVNLELKKGEVLGIIGRNGMGKSTLLKIISRITAPTDGEVRIKGRVASLLEVGTGFHQELTGRANIYLSGAIHGMKRAEVNNKFDQIVEFSGVGKFIDTPVKRYSSGMFVRLGFAVAAFLEPEILVVDEVLAVGDFEFQKRAIDKMKHVSSDQGRSVFFVSHNMSSIKSLCNRVAIIDKGKIVKTGDPSEMVRHYLGTTSSSTGVVRLEQIRSQIEARPSPYSASVIQVKEVFITDGNDQPLNTIENSDDSFIKVIIECRDTVRDLVVILTLMGDNETALLSTQNTDDKQCAEKVSLLERGLYKVICKLPRHLLGKSKYRLSVDIHTDGSSSMRGRRQNLRLQDVLVISANFSPYNQKIYTTSESSLFRPLLSWDLERI